MTAVTRRVPWSATQRPAQANAMAAASATWNADGAPLPGSLIGGPVITCSTVKHRNLHKFLPKALELATCATCKQALELIPRDGHVEAAFLLEDLRDLTAAVNRCRRLLDLDADPEVRAIVIAGSGKHFSFGLDLPAMSGEFGAVLADKAQAGPRTKFHDMIKRMQSGINAVADCRKPVVAAVQGWCIGGGVNVAISCDIRIASSDSVFSIPAARLGLVEGAHVALQLPLNARAARQVAVGQLLRDHRGEDRIEAGLQLLRQRHDLLGDIVDPDHRRAEEQAEHGDIDPARSPLDRVRGRQRHVAPRHPPQGRGVGAPIVGHAIAFQKRDGRGDHRASSVGARPQRHQRAAE